MRLLRCIPLLAPLLISGCFGRAAAPLSAAKQAEFNKVRADLGIVDSVRAGSRFEGRIVGYEVVRCPAIMKLIRLHRDAAADAFGESLSSQALLVRLGGAVGLAKMRDAGGTAVLKEIATDGESGEAVRATALFHLARLKRDGDDRFFLDLLTTVHDPPLTTNVVAAAIDGWAAWGERVDRSVIRDRLNDEDESLRIAVYTTLTRFVADALTAQRKALSTKDREATIREAAAKLPPDALAEQAAIDAAAGKRLLKLAAVRYAAACKDVRALDILRTAVTDDDAEVRLVAAGGLSLFGTRADARLIQPLAAEKSMTTALAGVTALRLIGDAAVLADCIADEGRWQVRAAIVKALTELDAAALVGVWHSIEPLAAERSLVVRITVAEAAKKAADPVVIPAVCTLLAAPSTVVRRKALAAANHVTKLKLHLPAAATTREREQVIATLTDWLRTHHPKLAAGPALAAPQALDAVQTQTLVRLIAEVGKSRGAVDPRTLDRLAELGPAAVRQIETEPRDTPLWTKLRDDALPTLDEAYRHLRTLRADSVAARRQGALALAGMSSQRGFSSRVREEIIARLRVGGDYFVFRYLLRALTQSPAASVPADQTDPLDEALIACLKQSDGRIRAEAVDALAQRKPAAAVDPLIRALDDDLSAVIVASASALGRLGEKRASASLLVLLTHRHGQVRLAASIALERLGSTRGRIELVGHLHGRSRSLATRAVDFLAEANCQWAVGHLVGLLAREDAEVVDRAAGALRELTGLNFGYSRTGSAAKRHEAIAGWNTWWARRGAVQPRRVSHTNP